MKIVWDVDDEIEVGLIENIRMGRAAIVDVSPDGEPLFQLTPKGEKEAKALLREKGRA